MFYIDPPPEDDSVAQTMTTSVTDSLLQIQETSQLTKTEPKKEHGVIYLQLKPKIADSKIADF